LKSGETIKQVIASSNKLTEETVRTIIKWELKDILSEVKKKLKKLYGPKLFDVILYGSYARGDYDQNSDIDLLVV